MLLRFVGVKPIHRLGNAVIPGRLYRWMWHYPLNASAERFVANSLFTQSTLEACGVPRSKIALIYNRADERSHLPVTTSRESNLIVYVGQLIPPKGVHILLDAVGLLRQEGIPARLHLVGAVERWAPDNWRHYLPELEARAERPDLAGAVSFLGFREDVPMLLAAATVHCLPSLPEMNEGFGLAVLEAKWAATPSVVFPNGPLPELVRHQVDGWICSRSDAQSLADGLRYFLVDSQRAAQAGKHAKDSANNFAPAKFRNQVLTVFGIKPPKEYCGVSTA
jgi:glycosyltransferase involved in cell wall biosynthesis